jgi:putative transposase
MPSGLHHYQHTVQLHFITFSCHGRKAHLGTPARRDLFESALERIRRRYRWAVLGFVVMPEHVHFLVNEPEQGNLARVIQALKLSVAVRRRERPFWQARYYDFNVWSAEKQSEKLCYIHRNPVARGLVARPEDWKWSSFRHYATGCEGPVEIESFWTARGREHRVLSQVSVIDGRVMDWGSCFPGSQRRDPGHPH